MIATCIVKGFKSLHDVEVDLAPLTVLVGANGSGKSSLLQAIWLVSQTGVLGPGDGISSGYGLKRRFSLGFEPARLTGPDQEPLLRIVAPNDDWLQLAIEVSRRPEKPHTFVVSTQAGGDGAVLRIPGEHPFGALDALKRFAGVAYLHLDAAQLAKTWVSDEEQPRLRPDGSALASTLAWLAGAEPSRLVAIARDLAAVVPGVKAIRTLRAKVHASELEQIHIDDQPVWRPVEREHIGDRFEIEFETGPRIAADLLSEGTLLALGLITKLHEPDGPKVLLLDDIDRGLHIEAQAKLIAVLKSMTARDPELQIVCSTHSPYLLDRFEPDQIRVFALDEARHTHVRQLTAHPEFDKWRFGVQTGELWATLGSAWAAQPRPVAAR